MSKQSVLLCGILTALLLLGCLFSLPFLMFAVVIAISAAIVLLSLREATMILFYFSPLSYILIFKQYNLYFFLIVAYMIAVLLKRKNASGFIALALLMAYCVVFANHSTLKIGDLIYPLLLMVLMMICQFTERRDYRILVKCFLVGFLLSAIVGIFKSQIPMLEAMWELDMLYIEGVETSRNIQRYAGLSYDPNFFALLICVLSGSILFSNQKTTLFEKLAIVVLMVMGFFTFSKSYILLLAIILVAYIIEYSKHPFKILISIAGVLGCLLLVEYFSSIQILALIEARFTVAEDANDLTTGRVDLWKMYIEYIFSDIRCFLVGRGFNAAALRKAAHNTYIDFIYRFGIIGTACWVVYFFKCKAVVSALNGNKRSFNMTPLLLGVGVFFLSAFHFQQLWCCLFFALIAPYLKGEDYEKTECDCTDI